MVFLDDPLFARLHDFIVQRGVTKVSVVRTALIEFLDRNATPKKKKGTPR